MILIARAQNIKFSTGALECYWTSTGSKMTFFPIFIFVVTVVRNQFDVIEKCY